MCISAVDPSKLHTAEFIYLISEYAGESPYLSSLVLRLLIPYRWWWRKCQQVYRYYAEDVHRCEKDETEQSDHGIRKGWLDFIKLSATQSHAVWEERRWWSLKPPGVDWRQCTLFDVRCTAALRSLACLKWWTLRDLPCSHKPGFMPRFHYLILNQHSPERRVHH